jgi:hypothetical protein
MTGAFRPSARRGRALAERLRDRLAGSFAHLLEACGGHAALDAAAIGAKVAEIGAAERVRAEIFIIHRLCVAAAVSGARADIAGGFAALCAAPVAAAPGIATRNWGDASFGAREAAHYAFAFGEEGDTRVALSPALPAMYAQACEALGAALAVLRRVDAELAGEIEALVTEVVFAQGRIDAETEFDGISSFTACGALVLNAAENRTPAAMLTTLVHEAAHGVLFAAAEGRPLVENAPGTLYASPLRRDRRPMNGVFHATFVCARMAYALERVLAAGAFAGAERAAAEGHLATARRAFAEGHATVRAHGVLTPLGAELMDAAQAEMSPVSA